MRTALTIAGSDSSGGAGIQADLKTFAAHGIYGTTAITAITAQSRSKVVCFEPVAPDLVAAQIEAIASDVSIDAAKTGMLATAAIVTVVADAIERNNIPYLVVDPVLVSTSGIPLLDASGIEAMRERLLRRAYVVTPNVPEAETLSGIAIRNDDDLMEAARRIRQLGPSAVIVTGGHRPTADIVDLLYDGEHFVEFHGERIEGKPTHGTGCTFAAALTAQLALGRTLHDAVPLAQSYVADAIRHGEQGLNHFWRPSIY